MLAASISVDAFIFREYELEEVVHACSNVIFGKINSIDQERMWFTINDVKTIKGAEQFEQIKISLAIGRRDFPKQLMNKLSANIPIVIFYIPVGHERLEALGYVSDIWIRLFSVRGSSGNFKWYFTHTEKYMNRTFDGDVLELQSLIRDIPAGVDHNNLTNIDEFVRHRYTLEEVVLACSNVIFGKVDSIDKKNMCIAVNEIENIKGKDQAEQMKINLAIGRIDSTKQVIDKIRVGAPIVIFYVPIGGKRIEALGYVSGIWIRLFAVHGNTKTTEWYFAHIEKYLNHVFDDDASKLQLLVRGMVSEKKTARAEPLK